MAQPEPSSRKINYRGHNNYDEKAASDEATLPPQLYGESLTVQAHAEDADLNVLMKRFGITGKMPENVRMPTYGDFSHITDYRTALEAVRAAHESFMEIPADVRAKFDNDPQRFLEFVDNPANGEQLVQLGLATRRNPPPAEPAPSSPPEGGGA